MLNRIAVFYRSQGERIRSMVSESLGEYRRYAKACIKAVEAAQQFLALPSERNVFEPLTPVLLEIDHSKRYESELLHALKNDQVRNIAITGEYGAGKSSLIRTFVDRHPEFTYAYVSLATFGKEAEVSAPGEKHAEEKSATKSDGSNETTAIVSGRASEADMPEKKAVSDLMERIEETIVQQLLYAVPARRLPKSRLKRIIQASTSRIWIRTIIFFALILAALRVYLPVAEKLPKIEPTYLLEWFLRIPGLLAIITLAAGGVYLLFNGLKLSSLFSIDGLTLKGGKLETTHHGSVLHKNVDEIIYCFERSSINVVVIEDIDRFGLHDVFTRLREINFIIKRSPQIKRAVYFVYALRDDMFAVGEKTKFFDLIIPVIPVINSENSQEKMFELLAKREFRGAALSADLDLVLVETVCYYIDDMRLIKNIVNEFDMFSSILGGGLLQLVSNKLFAIVVIRNLHPGAYADLVKRQGPIYDLIHGFETWRTALAKGAEDEIQLLRRKREARAQEIAEGVTELRTYLWYALMTGVGEQTATHVQIDQGNSFTLAQFVTDEVFKRVSNSSTQLRTFVTCNHGQNSRSQRAMTTSDLLASTYYQERCQLLQTSTGKIDDEIAAQLKVIARINRMTFRAAVKDGYSEVIQNKLQGLDVVGYLMRAGFLDTDYTDYFGYFYQGSLTPEDKNLILAFRRGLVPEVATQVSDAGKVIQKLDGDDLDDGRGIVADLIRHLCSRPYGGANPNVESGKLSIILRSGVIDHLDRLGLATEILLSRENHRQFILAAYELEPDVFSRLLDGTDAFQSAEAKQPLICAVLDYLDAGQLQKLADHECSDIYEAISNLEDVSRLMLGLEAGEMGWTWLRQRPVRFNRLGGSVLLDDLKKLIQWRFIEVNHEMLSFICLKAEDRHETNAYIGIERVVTYRRLQALGIESLDDLLFESPDDFVAVLLSQRGMLDESANSLSKLLNAIPQQPAFMAELLKRTECKFKRLEGAPQTLWEILLQNDRIEMKAEAVWTYFNQAVVPFLQSDKLGDLDIFTQFIQLHTQEIRDSLWGVAGRSDLLLQRLLLHSTAVSNDTLKALFANVVLRDASLLDGQLSVERWAMLAESKLLPYSVEIQERVSTHASEFEAVYLQTRWKEACDHLKHSLLAIDLVLALSKSSVPTLDEKMTMWAGVTLEALGSCDGAAAELARVCGAANLQSIRFAPSIAPLLQVLATEPTLDSELRSEAIIQCLELIVWPEVAVALSFLDDDGFGAISAGGEKIEVPFSDVNLRLLKTLESRELVHSVNSTEDTIIAMMQLGGGEESQA